MQWLGKPCACAASTKNPPPPFSCECAKAPRLVIAANCPPEQKLFDDVLDEKMDSVLPEVDMYVAGFSCKPFSRLHHQTRLLDEQEAGIFFAVVRKLKKLRPPAFVFENAEGIKRCMPQVLALLRDVGYNVIVELLNPLELGEPVSRPRYYFIGTRKDVSSVSEADATAFFLQIMRW